MKQEGNRLVGCSAVEGASKWCSLFSMLREQFLSKRKMMVLQAEPNSIQILAKDQATFPFCSVQTLSSFSAVDMFYRSLLSSPEGRIYLPWACGCSCLWKSAWFWIGGGAFPDFLKSRKKLEFSQMTNHCLSISLEFSLLSVLVQVR